MRKILNRVDYPEIQKSNIYQFIYVVFIQQLNYIKSKSVYIILFSKFYLSMSFKFYEVDIFVLKIISYLFNLDEEKN